MTTSIYNQRRRKARASTKRHERRRMRRTEGDWKFPHKIHPNAQEGRDQRNKDKK